MSSIALFHDDNDRVFDKDGMRAKARAVILNSSLIKRCMQGDSVAINALHLGFWYFVQMFEKVIDEQKLPRKPLYAKFQSARGLIETAQQIRTLANDEFETTFGHLQAEVREMQREEYKHSTIWRLDAKHLGIKAEDLEGARVVPGVKALVDSARTTDLVVFFAVLAGTEFIAEELGDILNPRVLLFVLLFINKRWLWGEIHTIPHGDGPSHLDIDLDLARAYDQTGDPHRIEVLIERTIAMFGAAADEVERHFASKTPIRVAAE